MRIDIVNLATSEQISENILSIDNFRLCAEQFDETKWMVRVNSTYRLMELFDTKEEAIQEMNGVHMDRIEAQRKEQKETLAAAQAKVDESDEYD